MAHIHSASGETVAHIYNLGLASDDSAHVLSAEMVRNAFYAHALLENKACCSEILEVPHHGLRQNCFNGALAERNAHMEGVGQPHWAYTCDECEHILVPIEDDPDQTWSEIHVVTYLVILSADIWTIGCLSACVMDGVTHRTLESGWVCTDTREKVISKWHARYLMIRSL